MNRGFLACSLTTLLLATPLIAEDTELVADRDNTLFGPVDNDLSSGAGTSLYAGRTASGALPNDRRRALLRFDVSGIPAGATVVSAAVTLQVTQVPPLAPTNVAFSLHRCEADWGEAGSSSFGGAGAVAQKGDATWFFRSYPNQSWDTPGGDYASVASESVAISGLGSYEFAGDGLVADVQAWIDGDDNHGWVLVADESAQKTVRKFASRENASASLRPRLSVTWEMAGPAGDLNGDGEVDGADLGLLLSAWGSCTGCDSDLNGDGSVNGADLGLLLADWN